VFELVYVYLFIVETKGLSLEETAALFDEPNVSDLLENMSTLLLTCR
jgi:hypothetical protein